MTQFYFNVVPQLYNFITMVHCITSHFAERAAQFATGCTAEGDGAAGLKLRGSLGSICAHQKLDFAYWIIRVQAQRYGACTPLCFVHSQASRMNENHTDCTELCHQKKHAHTHGCARTYTHTRTPARTRVHTHTS